jgi:hypothetical protein
MNDNKASEYIKRYDRDIIDDYMAMPDCLDYAQKLQLALFNSILFEIREIRYEIGCIKDRMS